MTTTTIDVRKDPDQLTMTMTAELAVGAERAWQLWSDPRQLERWWGPPTYPATFTDHDLTPGGLVGYYMTGPEGDRHRGWWRILESDPPRLLVLEDGFADESGKPADGMPAMEMRVSFVGSTTMSIETTFPSFAEMEQMIEMGMDEGMRAAMGQIAGVLAD